MATENSSKPTGKGGENLLSLLGSLGSVAGPLIFGPEWQGDLGAPFKAGASMLKDKREQDNLLKLLKSTPHTAPLAEHIPAIINAGGVANNTDLLSHPDIQGMFNVPSSAPTTGAMPGEAGGGLLQAIQPSSTPQDYSSDEFLQRAAEYRPDIAEKLLANRASKGAQDPKELLQTILLGKQIAGFETPEQKRQAALDDRLFMAEQTDKLIGARQEQNQERQTALAKSKITPKEEEGFNTVDELRKAQQNILIDIESGIEPSFTKDLAASLIPGGERILQATDPKFAAFRKNIGESLAIYQKSISGVAISEPEARRLKPTQPQAGDDINVLRGVAQNNVKKANEVYFIKAMNAANRGADVSQYVDPQQLQLYKAVRAAMNHDLKAALANPRVMQLRKQLGIDYGADNINVK